MQTLIRPKSSKTSEPGFKPPRPRRKRFSPFMLIAGIVTIVIALGASAFLFTRPNTGTHAANDNPDCTLILPAQPLSANGLATPFQLVATNPDNGPCHEANAMQTAFVEGIVIDPATGKISIYDPLVIDKGTKPAIAPVVPNLPNNAIVALWFGFNGANLTLKGKNNALQNGNCVNGAKGAIFGQFSYCNAPAFFQAANNAIQAGKLVPPALGTGKDGLTCPTVRDFGIVDQDQSDNVTTAYLVDRKGRTAQMTAANAAKLGDMRVLVNGSDNRLLSVAVDGALGCKPWTAPDLADPGQSITALPLNELQAAAHQGTPIAVVPSRDPMVLLNNKPNLVKLNAYRAGVDQPQVNDLAMADTKAYCTNLLDIAPQRMLVDKPLTINRASPDPAAANNLFTFLAQRFNTTWGAMGLNCQKLLKKNSPIKVTTDDNGVAVEAKINDTTTGGGNGNGKGNGNGNGKGNAKGDHNGNGKGDNNGN